MGVEMHIDDARQKLSDLQTELEQIPANCHTRADREYRIYLEMNIATFEQAIQAFDEGQKSCQQ